MVVDETGECGGPTDDEVTVTPPANVGEPKRDPVGDSGRGTEAGDWTGVSTKGEGSGIGSGGTLMSPIAIDGKDEDECRASARRASSSGKQKLEAETRASGRARTIAWMSSGFCDSIVVVVNGWSISSKTPSSSFTLAKGRGFHVGGFSKGISRLGNKADRDLRSTSPMPQLLSICRLAALIPGNNILVPNPADLGVSERRRSTWVSLFAKSAYTGDKSGEKSMGVSGNV